MKCLFSNYLCFDRWKNTIIFCFATPICPCLIARILSQSIHRHHFECLENVPTSVCVMKCLNTSLCHDKFGHAEEACNGLVAVDLLFGDRDQISSPAWETNLSH